MDKRKVIYYNDPLNDEFSTAVITPKKIDGDYVYYRKGVFWSFVRFFAYRIVATPIAFFYSKCVLHQHTVGKEKLKPFKKQGVYLYGNHTQDIGDPFMPNVFCFPKNVSFIVHPNNVSMPVLGRINPYLGAIPIPDTKEAVRNFTNCIDSKIKNGGIVAIYPEAHIWPFYTGIRPFTDTSFSYPAKSGTPVFCFVNTYQRRRSDKFKIVTYIEGPFYPDMELSFKARKKDLRDRVYNTMTGLSKNSNIEVIKYIQSSSNRSGE